MKTILEKKHGLEDSGNSIELQLSIQWYWHEGRQTD